VTPATNVDRTNYVFLRFPTGDRITLVEDYPSAPDSFTYVVPDTPMGSVTAAAVEGNAYAGDYAVVHQSGLAAGSTATMAIPLPGSLVAPVDGVANVDLTTEFSYLAGAGSAGTHLVAIRSTFDSCCNDAIYIATTKTQFTIPEVVGGNFLKGGEGYFWRVETHGELATVDAMTGPTGFMDAFSADEETPQGPRTDNGQYTVTSSRIFTAAQ
jgi:hypothetical protein